MYAILQQSGHQYRVSPGDRLVVDRLDAEVGSVVALEPVVLVQGDDGTQVGTPVIDGVRVAALVVGHAKGGKIRVFKYKPKKRYRRTHGHRSLLTELRIEAVLAKGEKLPEPAPAPAKAEKAEAKPAAKGRARGRGKAEAEAETTSAIETAAVEAEAEATEAPATTPKRGRTAAAKAAAAAEAEAPQAMEAPEGAEEGAQGAAPAAAPEAAAEESAPKRRSRARKAEAADETENTPATDGETEA